MGHSGTSASQKGCPTVCEGREGGGKHKCTTLGQEQYHTGPGAVPHWARSSTTLGQEQYHTGPGVVPHWARSSTTLGQEQYHTGPAPLMIHTEPN